MPVVTVWASAVTSSTGVSDPGNALGAPNSLRATIPGSSQRTLGVTVNPAGMITDPVGDIITATLIIAGSRRSGGSESHRTWTVTGPGGALGTGTCGSSSDYTDFTVALTGVTWADLATVTVALSNANSASTFIVDAVGIELKYTLRLNLGTGTATAVSAAEGTVTARRPLAGTAVAASTASGAMTARPRVSGTAAATSTASGSLQVAVPGIPLAGTATAVSAASGAITARLPLAGTAAATSTASGAITARLRVSGTAAATSTAKGTMTARLRVSGTAAATSTASGAVTARILLDGTATAASAAGDDGHGLTLHIGIVLLDPPRSIDELITTGTAPRHDHVLILTGDHAGRRLPITAGRLLLDETADVRATGTLDVAAEPWVRDLLDPRARTELAIIAALEDDLGERHEWQLAIVHPVTPAHTLSATTAPTLSVAVADRADWAKHAGMRDRRVFAAGTLLVDVIATLIAERAPGLPIALDQDPARLSVDAVLGDLGADPWAAAADLARGIGRVLHVDPHGIVRAPLLADPLVAPIADHWIEGSSRLTGLSVTVSDTDIVNIVGVPWKQQPREGEASDDMPGGIEYWEDRTSSTSIARVGERVRAYSGDSSVVTDPQQAARVATLEGLTLQGLAVTITTSGARWDPRRQIGDAIHIRRPELAIDMVTRITALEYTLGGPVMGVTLAERRTT